MKKSHRDVPSEFIHEIPYYLFMGSHVNSMGGGVVLFNFGDRTMTLYPEVGEVEEILFSAMDCCHRFKWNENIILRVEFYTTRNLYFQANNTSDHNALFTILRAVTRNIRSLFRKDFLAIDWMEKWKTFDCSNRNKTDQLSFTIYNGIITVAPKGNILPTVIIPMDSTVTISRRNTLHISSNLKRIYLAMSEENLVEAMSLLAKCRHRIVPHPRIITDYKSGPMIDLLEYAYRLVEEDELYPEECLEHFDELCEVLKYIGKKKYATKQQKITYNEEKFQKRDKPSDPPPEFPEDDLMQYVIKANPFTEVRRLESIGKGGFGEVFKAQKKSDGSIIALKILKHSIKERYVKIGQEVARMSTWKHENMIEIEKCWLYEGKVYITMPLCEIGNIKNVVKDKKHAFTLCDVAYVIQCILKPLEYIHQQGFIHRDIKPANILMMCDGSIKLIDFGLVTRKCLNPHTRSGSKQYMAPEVVLQKVYNEKADIWSVGCVTQELAEGKSPYREDGIVKLLFRTVTTGAMGLRRIKYWDNTFVDFVEKCFVYDPNTRSSARELLEHPFIDWASSSYYYKKCHGMAEK